MSEISIQMGEDGWVGVINGEPVSYDCDVRDDDMPNGGDYRIRRFRIPLGGGYLMSVTFGTGSYSENHWTGGFGVYRDDTDDQWKDVVANAEIGVLGPEGGLVELFSEEWGDTVMGYCDAKDILNWVIAARRRIKERQPD